MKTAFLKDEVWYGGASYWGIDQPLNENSGFCADLTKNTTPNQAVMLFVSSKGRCLYSKTGQKVCFCKGEIEYPDTMELVQAGQTLKEAYRYAAKNYLHFDGKMPAKELFEAPIFNSWIELTFYQSQEGILEYARSIVKNGFEAGVLMIDDGWSECYGEWKFHSGKFPNPKAMLDELHEMGFSVMLWLVPYISPDSMAFRYAQQNGYLVNQPDGQAYLVRWWNGCSAALDLSNPQACEWLHSQLKELQKMGVDGFKFDGGDPMYYAEDNQTKGNLSPNEQSEAWCAFGQVYPFNEYRSSWNAAGKPLFQRLCDKHHSWDKNGIAALIPDTLAQGITGHPFGCADMVGGGEYMNFAACSDKLDTELFVCHSSVSCLMPAIQFSAAPWRILEQEKQQQIHKQLELRKAFLPYLQKLLQDAANTGEPIVRYMEYEFPHQGRQNVTDQFMLGDTYLVAPVLEKGKSERTVCLPKGKWQYGETVLYSNGEVVCLKTEQGMPIVLKRIEERKEERH